MRFVWSIMLVISYCWNEKFISEWIFGFLFSIFVIEYIWCIYSSKRVIINKQSDEKYIQIEKGENLKVVYIIRNKSFLPTPYFFMRFNQNFCIKEINNEPFCLSPYETKEVVLEIEGELSGIVDLAVTEVVFESLLKSCKYSVREVIDEREQQVHILPRILEESPIKKAVCINNQSFVNDKSEVDEYNGELAPYTNREPMKDISWRYFAQYDKLMVRVREEVNKKNKYILILDNVIQEKQETREFYKQGDKLREAYLYRVSELINKNYNVSLVVNKKGTWRILELENLKQSRDICKEMSANMFKSAMEKNEESRNELIQFLHQQDIGVDICEIVLIDKIEEGYKETLERVIRNKINVIEIGR